MYESIKELCLDLGYEDITDLEVTPEGEFEVFIDGIDIKDVIANINSDLYYSKMVRKVTLESITITEKQFINGQWNWVVITFRGNDLGVRCIASILSVPYYSEYGDYFNVSSREIANALRKEELMEIIE